MTKTVRIPFNKWSKIRLEKEIKVVTRRTKTYGEIGDTFLVYFRNAVKTYTLTKIYKQKLGDMTDEDYKKEGAEDKADFIKVWKSIFRGEYDPERVVDVHEFEERVSDG